VARERIFLGCNARGMVRRVLPGAAALRFFGRGRDRGRSDQAKHGIARNGSDQGRRNAELESTDLLE